MEPRTRLALLVPLSLGFIAPALHARPAPAPFQQFGDAGAFNWPATLTASGPVRSPVAGKFLDAFHTDVYFLRTNQLFFMYQPELFELVFAPTITHPVGTDLSVIRDVARIPGQAGAHDTLALVAPSGLFQLTASATSFDATSLSASPNWNNALMLRTGDFDGSGGLDFLGLGATGKAIAWRLDSSSGVSEYRFTTPTTITAMEPLQWDLDPEVEVAVLNNYGVVVYELDGSIATYNGGPAQFPRVAGTTGGSICVVTDVGETRQRIAYLRTDNTYDPGLVEISQLYGAVVSVPVLPFKAMRLTSIDADASLLTATAGEHGTDLMMVHSEDAAPIVFLNHESGLFRFEPHTGTWGSICPTNSALALTPTENPGDSLSVVDLELDGRPDVMVFAPTGPLENGVHKPQFSFLKALLPQQTAEFPPSGGQVAGTGGEFTPFKSITFCVDSPTLGLNTLANLDLDFGTCPPLATHVEITVWTQPSEFGLLDPVSVSHTMHPLSPLAAQVHPQIPFAFVPTYYYANPGSTQCWGEQIYWFEARFVKASSSITEIQESYPGYIAYVSADHVTTQHLFQAHYSSCKPGYHTTSGVDLKACPPEGPQIAGNSELKAPRPCNRRRVDTAGGTVVPTKLEALEGGFWQ